MINKFSKYFYFIICSIFFLIAALYFSDLLVVKLLNGFSYSNELFSLNYIENTGAAFSILKDARELLIIVSVVAICLIVSYIIKHISQLSLKSLFFLSMLVAGIGGNLHERILFGFVRDYFELNFVEFPVFNISDIFINIGIIAIIVIILKHRL